MGDLMQAGLNVAGWLSVLLYMLHSFQLPCSAELEEYDYAAGSAY